MPEPPALPCRHCGSAPAWDELEGLTRDSWALRCAGKTLACQRNRTAAQRTPGAAVAAWNAAQEPKP